MIGVAADEAAERHDAVDPALAGDAGAKRSQLEHTSAAAHGVDRRSFRPERSESTGEELLDDLGIPPRRADRESHARGASLLVGLRRAAAHFFGSCTRERRWPSLSRFTAR